ncbi:hypothetical protein [Microbacterium arborescens]
MSVIAEIEPEAPSIDEVLNESTQRIATAAAARDEETLAEVRDTLARLAVFYLVGGEPRAIEVALQSDLAGQHLRSAIAYRVYPIAKGRAGWRKSEGELAS